MLSVVRPKCRAPWPAFPFTVAWCLVWGRPALTGWGRLPCSPSRSGSGGRPASGVLDVDRQAFLDRARAAKALKPRRDLGVVEVGIVAAAGADHLECVGVAAFHPAVHEAERLTPQPCCPAVARLARRRECHDTLAVCVQPPVTGILGVRGAGTAPGRVAGRGPVAMSGSAGRVIASPAPDRPGRASCSRGTSPRCSAYAARPASSGYGPRIC
jgi:hypothetical protein